jgi:hypothetical protein
VLCKFLSGLNTRSLQNDVKWRERLALLELPSRVIIIIIIIIIIIFFHGLGHLNSSGIDALQSFPGTPTISSSSRLVVEGVFRESGVVHSFKMFDPILFVFGAHYFFFRARSLIIWYADIQGYASLLISTLFSLEGLPAHPQNPHSWRTSLSLLYQICYRQPQLYNTI